MIKILKMYYIWFKIIRSSEIIWFIAKSLTGNAQNYLGILEADKGWKVAIFGRIWSNFGVKKVFSVCNIVLHLGILQLKDHIQSMILTLNQNKYSITSISGISIIRGTSISRVFLYRFYLFP